MAGDLPFGSGSTALNAPDLIDDLRRERYARNGYPGKRPLLSSSPVRQAYYRMRPLLPILIRRYVQQAFHLDWRSLRFPNWPVDTTVEDVLERLMALAVKASGVEAIPFIWFWPEGASACLILTHDVESKSGVAFLPALMDLDDSFGFKASFQLIPRKQYPVSSRLLDEIRGRGFEVNVQDLTHEGNLFDDRQRFLRRAGSINAFLREYGARGFRAGRMFRNVDWYDALDVEYDMSVPNVAHLDPQRGGCCTIFPWFISNVLELPLTTTQDYTLFHILGEYSTELWTRQLFLITSRHGLASFIVHPDYIQKQKELRVYKELLHYLTSLRDRQGVWSALPGEVNTWWRQRSQMQLVHANRTWTIHGSGSERARIAWARLVDGRFIYTAAPDSNETFRF